uniref:Uncharacterized protein n=1 Tax=Rhizophora mucronata TaxID=61149 RepID=A0A2P2QGK3_RHIMU
MGWSFVIFCFFGSNVTKFHENDFGLEENFFMPKMRRVQIKKFLPSLDYFT